jgi:hypothetical protein
MLIPRRLAQREMKVQDPSHHTAAPLPEFVTSRLPRTNRILLDAPPQVRRAEPLAQDPDIKAPRARFRTNDFFVDLKERKMTRREALTEAEPCAGL